MLKTTSKLVCRVRCGVEAGWKPALPGAIASCGFSLVLLCSVLLASPSVACDGSQHSDCFSQSRYKTIAECDLAIKRDKSDFHAWLDRAILKNQIGQEAEAVTDINQAIKVLGKVKR